LSKLISKTAHTTNSWVSVGTDKKQQILEIDTQSTDSLWHKVAIHALLPKKTQIELAYIVANQDIPDPTALPDAEWSEPTINQKHVLIDASKGQRLYLKLTLTSNKKGKYPTVKTVKATYSNVNYLEHLPAFYQEDPINLDFLKRYLAVFETVLQKLEYQIEDLPELLDAKLTSSEFLPWLSTWVGAVEDENWPEGKWREFLSQAATLYRHRGTKRELEEIIKIYTGQFPVEVVERALLKTGNKQYQKFLDTLFGDKYSFCVLLRPWQVKTEVDQKVIKRVIEGEKPAHTIGGYVVLEDKIFLDWHSYLGVNSYVVEPKAEMTVGKAQVSVNTVISERSEVVEAVKAKADLADMKVLNKQSNE
jgi:phage tail-like protein